MQAEFFAGMKYGKRSETPHVVSYSYLPKRSLLFVITETLGAGNPALELFPLGRQFGRSGTVMNSGMKLGQFASSGENCPR